jgi:hypothetical protein
LFCAGAQIGRVSFARHSLNERSLIEIVRARRPGSQLCNRPAAAAAAASRGGHKNCHIYMNDHSFKLT